MGSVHKKIIVLMITKATTWGPITFVARQSVQVTNNTVHQLTGTPECRLGKSLVVFLEPPTQNELGLLIGKYLATRCNMEPVLAEDKLG